MDYSKKYYQFSSVFQGAQAANDDLDRYTPDFSKISAQIGSDQQIIKDFIQVQNFQQQQELFKNNQQRIYTAFFNVIDKGTAQTDLLRYILLSLDGIFWDDRSNFQALQNVLSNNRSYITSLRKIFTEQKFQPTIYEAAAKVLAYILSRLEVSDYKQQQSEALNELINLRVSTTVVKISDHTFATSIAHLLKIESLVTEFLERQGTQILLEILKNNSSNLQTSYSVLLAIWLVSYVEESVDYLNKTEIIKTITEVIQKLGREKLVRVAFATFRNLCDISHESIELMVEAQLLKFIEIQLKGNTKDADIQEDLKYVGEILEQNLKILSSFEKYQKEILSQNLSFSPVHTEKFWRENIKKFEDDGYMLIERLNELLNGDVPINQAVACYDLGEFCRFNPYGKSVLEKYQTGGKTRIMQLAKSDNQQVREQALLALQKIMLHNWNIQSQK